MNLTEEELVLFSRMMKELKTSEDILARAKMILRKYSDQLNLSSEQTMSQQTTTYVSDVQDLLFLRVIFSFHPTRDLP